MLRTLNKYCANSLNLRRQSHYNIRCILCNFCKYCANSFNLGNLRNFDDLCNVIYTDVSVCCQYCVITRNLPKLRNEPLHKLYQYARFSTYCAIFVQIAQYLRKCGNICNSVNIVAQVPQFPRASANCTNLLNLRNLT